MNPDPHPRIIHIPSGNSYEHDGVPYVLVDVARRHGWIKGDSP